LITGSFTNLYAKSTSNNDTLARAQRTLTDAMKANNIRLRVASENMANNKTADYIPKQIEMKAKKDPKTKSTSVAVKSITQDKNKIIQVGGCKSLTQVRGGITFSNIIRLSSTK